MNIQKNKVTGFAVAVAVLGTVAFGSGLLHNQPSVFATDPAPATAEAQAFDFAAFKKAYVKEGVEVKSDLKWASDSAKEAERIAAAIETLKAHVKETGQAVEAITPRATQMAILSDIAKFVKTSETATKEAVAEKANASIAYHKATRKLIDIFVTRDDATKKDTWKLQDGAAEKIVAAYAEIYKTDMGKEALKDFGADFAADAEKTGQLQAAAQSAFDELKDGKSKTSIAILTKLRTHLTEAVAYSGEGEAKAEALAALTTGDAAATVTAVTIPEATAANKLRLKVDSIASDHKTVTNILKETDGQAAMAFDIDVVDAAGGSATLTKSVTIKLQLGGELKKLFDNNKTVVLYHVAKDGKREKVDYIREADTITFSATSFSPYVFVAEKAAANAPAGTPANPGANAAQTADKKDSKGSTGLADTGSAYIAPVLAGVVITGLGVALLARRS